jgi:hypothetical protein
MSRKVFTAGEVLAAADVNSFLMDQTVMSFAGTAARGSAIPSPVEGMYTHLEDTDRLQFWNGSSWRSPEGLVHIKTTTFTGVTSVSLGSNADPIFTSEFDNYKIMISSGNSTSVDRNWSIRFRSNTTDNTDAAYTVVSQGINIGSGLVNNVAQGQTSSIIQNNAYYDATQSVTFDLFNPFNAGQTTGHGTAMGMNSGGFLGQSIRFVFENGNSFNGFSLFNSSGNFNNGKVSVFGYRKA